jgi:hypothetical protein
VFDLIPVPTAPSIVTTLPNDRRIFVQDRRPDGTLSTPAALVANGVNWSPASIGTPQADLTQEFAKWYQTDIPLMAQMGVNVVRVYHDFGTGPVASAILDEFYRYGIKVIMTVDSPQGTVVADMDNITTVVDAYKNHPAILMWLIGNEWDLPDSSGRYDYGQFATLTDAANFTEQAAKLVKSLDTNHPVATAIADPDIFGIHSLSPSFSPYDTVSQENMTYTSDIVNTLVPDVDVWDLQVYRGAMFGDVFNEWASISQKPILIGEYGADSYDHGSGGENQAMQAQFDAALWGEDYLNLSAERTSGISAGANVFEWNDEWWKNGSPGTHDISSETNAGQPDGYNDEEWFGIVDINRQPKAAYFALQHGYLAGLPAVALDAHPTIQVTSQVPYQGGPNNIGVEFQIDGKPAFLRFGAALGGRGVSLAVLDTDTGIRMTRVQTFDTWKDSTNFDPLVQALKDLPDGAVFALGIADEGGFVDENNQPKQDPHVQNAVATLQALGSTEVGKIIYNGAWAMIGIKGQGVLAEDVGTTKSTPLTIHAQVSLKTDANQGKRPDLAPPTLLPIPDQTAVAGQLKWLLAEANATDNGPTTLTYSLDTAPPGASIDPLTGLFTWTPSTGPTSARVTIRVTDRDNPSFRDAKTFKIDVISPPTGVAPTAGTTPQSATVNTAFATNLEVVVTDAVGNGVPNVMVTFTAPGSGASGVFAGGGKLATGMTDDSGVAVAPGFAANTVAGTYTVTASVAGVASPAVFALTNLPGAASQLVITQQPSATATAGVAFANQPIISEEDQFGNVETGDSSTVVTVTLASGAGPLQGTTSVSVKQGVATFTNLADNTVEIISLRFTSGSLAPVTSSRINVALVPKIEHEQVVMRQKTNKKGKPVGKPVFVGFALDYSTPMDPTSAGLAANYQVDSAITKRVKKKSTTVFRPVNFIAAYNPSTEAVTLTIRGKPKFARGGRIKVIASPPNGVRSAAGVLLDASDTVFTIMPKARGITPSVIGH